VEAMHNRETFLFSLYSLYIPNHLLYSTKFGTETNTRLLQAPGHNVTTRPDVANGEDGFRKWETFADIIHVQFKAIERSSIFEIFACCDKYYFIGS
jgi:hypothetical protein